MRRTITVSLTTPDYRALTLAAMPDDIRDSADLERLLRHFYGAVLQDPIIGFYFSDATDFELEAHLPRIRAFWQQQLFGGSDYRGRAFEAHLALHRHTAISEHHFRRWLGLFDNAVDTLFSGERAQQIKQRARDIAASMAEGLRRRGGEPSGSPGLHYIDPSA